MSSVLEYFFLQCDMYVHDIYLGDDSDELRAMVEHTQAMWNLDMKCAGCF